MSASSQPDASREKRLQRLLEEHARKRAAGKHAGDDELIAANADLLPELAERLREEALIRAARDEAGPADADPTRTHDEPAESDESAEAGPPLESIPGYQILRELNRGGQGVVYQAIQLDTKSKVAIKVLLAGRYASATARKRFEREIELVAQLKHPGIIRILQSGTTPDGRQFCVMDYVRGQPLTRYVRERKLGLEDALKLFARVCEALQYAHQRGVIHRDLKPSNILVDADGAAWILDFGMAKLLAQPEMTPVSVSQQVLGTLPYMSPEQVRGNPDEIDARTDIYSLGVIFYEMLTGYFPYPVVGQVADVLRHIEETAPTPPSRTWKADAGVARRAGRRRASKSPIDNEVETISLTALSKERERRYQSAGELARDIEHYLAGEPIAAKRDSLAYLLAKFARKHATRAGIALAVVLIVAVALSGAIHEAQRAADARGAALAADVSRRIREAQGEIDRGNYARALTLLRDEDVRGPQELEAGLVRARALNQMAQTADAARLLNELNRRHPKEAAVAYLLAQTLRQSDPDRAQEYLQRVAQWARDTPQDFYLRALAEKDDQQALELLGRALDKDAGYFEALTARSSRYFVLGDFQRARIDAERARSVRPNDRRAWFNLGTILVRLDEYKEGEAALRHAIKISPRDGASWYNLALALDLQGRDSEALPAYVHATEFSPDTAAVWFGLGRARLNRGDLEGAYEPLVRAVGLAPQHCESKHCLGLLFEQRGELERAAELYAQCVDLPGCDRPSVIWGAAETAGRLGRDAEALFRCMQVLALRPEDANALSGAAWICLASPVENLRDTGRGVEFAECAELAGAGDSRVLMALAQFRAGRYEAAFESAQAALRRTPDEPWSLLICDRAARKLGRTAGAMAENVFAVVAAAPYDPALDSFLCECVQFSGE